MPNAPVIAIDGPSGSGKGTVSRAIAQTFGWHLLDSGALYRVLAYYVLSRAIAVDDEARICQCAKNLPVIFNEQEIILEGQDISNRIRSEACGAAASKISIYQDVRSALRDRQRAFRQLPGLVADGRDMATVIFPDAEVKIFLEGDIQERAKRRFNELRNRGISATIGEILDDLKIRDDRDRNRQVAPLKPAQDSIIIDTTHLSISEVITQVKEIIYSRLGSKIM